MMSTEDEARIREIDQQLATLRGELGGPTDDAEDVGDAALAVTMRDEHNAMIEALEAERARLMARTGEA